MKLTIYSRRLNRQVTFSRPGDSYVYVDLNGSTGRQGNQVCHGGKLCGKTVTYHGDDLAAFAGICRSWWRAYLRKIACPEYPRRWEYLPA